LNLFRVFVHLDKNSPQTIGAAMPLAISAPMAPVMAASFLGGRALFIALLGEAKEAFLGGIFAVVAKETGCFHSSVLV
jgi:hypothetical protein